MSTANICLIASFFVQATALQRIHIRFVYSVQSSSDVSIRLMYSMADIALKLAETHPPQIHPLLSVDLLDRSFRLIFAFLLAATSLGLFCFILAIS